LTAQAINRGNELGLVTVAKKLHFFGSFSKISLY
jgi:hypothetical protein